MRSPRINTVRIRILTRFRFCARMNQAFRDEIFKKEKEAKFEGNVFSLILFKMSIRYAIFPLDVSSRNRGGFWRIRRHARIQKARPPTETQTRTDRDFIRRPRVRLYERDFVRYYLHWYVTSRENMNLGLLGLLGFITVNRLLWLSRKERWSESAKERGTLIKPVSWIKDRDK